jgi:hypothetical protein
MKNLILPFCRWRSLSVTLSVFFLLFSTIIYRFSLLSFLIIMVIAIAIIFSLYFVHATSSRVFFIWLFERRKEAEKEAEDTRGRLSNRLQASPSVQKKTNNKKKKRWRVRINSIWSYSVYISIRERERLELYRENTDRGPGKLAEPSRRVICFVIYTRWLLQ